MGWHFRARGFRFQSSFRLREETKTISDFHRFSAFSAVCKALPAILAAVAGLAVHKQKPQHCSWCCRAWGSSGDMTAIDCPWRGQQLVGGSTPLKRIVSWDHYSQHMESNKCSKPPTRQPTLAAIVVCRWTYHLRPWKMKAADAWDHSNSSIVMKAKQVWNHQLTF